MSLSSKQRHLMAAPAPIARFVGKVKWEMDGEGDAKTWYRVCIHVGALDIDHDYTGFVTETTRGHSPESLTDRQRSHESRLCAGGCVERREILTWQISLSVDAKDDFLSALL